MTLKKPDILENIEQLDNKIGDLSTLNTSDKASLKGAINEVNSSLADIPNQTYITEKAKQVDLNATNVTIANNYSTLDTKINSQASGSPKNTFATLALLQADATANTTDGKKGIYVITADGKWYYWNGAWTPGGTYQSSQDIAALVNELSDVNLKSLKYMNKAYGIMNGSGTSWMNQTSAYQHLIIPVNGGEKFNITCANSNTFIAMLQSYNTSVAPVLSTQSGFTARHDGSWSGTVPSDARFIWISVLLNNVETYPTSCKINDYDYCVSAGSTVRQLLKDYTDTSSREILGNNLQIINDSNKTAPYDNLNTFPDNSFAIYNATNQPTNSPFASSEKFSVLSFNAFKGNPGQGTTQIAIGESRSYARFSFGGTWNAWQLISPQSDIRKLVSGLTGTGIIDLAAMIAPYNDLDTFPNNTYALYSAGVQPSNSPYYGSTHFSIFTYNAFAGTAKQGATQIVSSEAGSFIRFSYGGTFSKWRRLTSFDDNKSSNMIGLYGITKTIVSKPLGITSSSKFLFVGDSITAKVSAQRGNPWVDYVMAHFGIPSGNYTNAAIAGADFAANGDYIIDEITQALTARNDYDFLYIAAGINDYRFDVDFTVLRTALDNISTYLSTHFSGKVIVQTPIQSPENTLNSVSRAHNLIDYSDVIFQWAMEKGYDVINGFDLGFAYEPESYVSKIYASDKLHPNDLGMQIYARGVETYLG
jgi:lysophospholipase L1-like esterase